MDDNQKHFFCVFCLDRVIELYKVIDQIEDLSEIDSSIKKGFAYDALNKIYLRLKEKTDGLDDLKTLLLQIDPLILDIENVFENSTDNEVAMLVAQGVEYFIKFKIEFKDEYVIFCAYNNLEILNQMKSEEFYSQFDDDEYVDELLEEEFRKETDIQKRAIDLIRNNNFESLISLTVETKICWK